MKVKTIAGVTYVVSAAGSCTVTARTDDGTAITLCALTSGGQKAFQAIGGEVEVSDSNAVVLPFADASVPLGMEGGVDAGMVAGMVEEAVTEEGEVEVRVNDGGSNAEARYVQIAGMHVPDGVVRKIAVKCRSTASDNIATGAMFLGVWEKDETGGGYTRLGSSTGAVAQVVGQEGEWSFEGLRLHGRTVRLAFLKEEDGLWPTSWDDKIMGVSCAARESGDTESLCMGRGGAASNLAAAVGFTKVVRVARFAAAEHVADAVAHLTSEEHEGLTGLLSGGGGGVGVELPAGNNLEQPVIGTGATGAGASSVAIGANANVTGTSSVVIGSKANVTGISSVAIGVNAKGTGTVAVAIGTGATVQDSAVAIGANATGAGASSVAIGVSASGAGGSSVVIGSKANVTGISSVAIGSGAIGNGDYSIVIGFGASLPYKNTCLIQVGAGTSKAQLYIFGKESELATNTNKEAGIGFVSGSQKGCIKLSELLTNEFTLPTT